MTELCAHHRVWVDLFINLGFCEIIGYYNYNRIELEIIHAINFVIG